jgi:hypothetical protein
VVYLCWPFAILHGLLAGRTAKPYVDWSYGACVALVALALVFRVAAGPRLGETAAGPAEEAQVAITSPSVPAAASLAGPGLTGAGLAESAGPGLPGAGPGSPFVPGSPPFSPGTQPPFVPGGTGAWGRRALPAPGDTSGLTRGHPSFPGLGGAEPGYPGPGHSDIGYPDAGHPDPSHPYQGWAGHDEPAQAPGPGDGGR